MLEAILHIGIDLPTILTKDDFFQVLEDLLVLLIDSVFRVSIEELLLISPKRLRCKGSLTATESTHGPEKDATHEDKEHDQLDPAKEESDHHCHTEPGQLTWTRIPINKRYVIAV